MKGGRPHVPQVSISPTPRRVNSLGIISNHLFNIQGMPFAEEKGMLSPTRKGIFSITPTEATQCR